MSYSFSQLDSLLEKKDITLEAILDEENILMELKNSGSQKFAKFVTEDPQIYARMIDYVTSYNPETKNPKQLIKYQFLVSEIFFSENGTLIDFLFDPIKSEQQEEDSKTEGEDQTQDQSQQHQDQSETGNLDKETQRQQLLPRLLDFLRQDTLCITSAGYFAKTLVPIIRRRGFDLWAYFENNPQILGHLIKHLDIHHIADIVEKLILIDISQNQIEETHLEARQQLLKRCLNLIQYKTYNHDIVENVSTIFNEIINRAAQNPQNSEWQTFFEILNKPKILFEVGVQSGSVNAFQVLINLVTYYQKIQKHKNEQKEANQDDDVANYDQDELESPTFEGFLAIITQISKYLQSTGMQGRAFQTTFGQNINPLSQQKLTLIQLLFNLLQTQNHRIIELIEQSNAFLVIQNLVLEHQFNNQLLILYDKIVTYVFSENQSVFYDLQDDMLRNGFLEFIINNNSNKIQQVGVLKNKVKPGFQGILTKLSNFLVQKAQTHQHLNQYLNTQEWQEYLVILNKINEIESRYLCDINPRQKPIDEDEWTEQDVDKILEKFRNQKPKQEEQQKEKEEAEIQNNQDDQEEQVDAGEDFADFQQGDENNLQSPEEKQAQDERDQEDEDNEKLKEKIDQTIVDVITSPQCKPKQIGELIDLQENLELQSHEMKPVDIETKSDLEVNTYWKTHDVEKTEEEN